MKYFFLASFFLMTVVTFLPLPASAAGLVPCGRNVGTAAEQAPCTLCHVIVGGKGLIDWGVSIMTVVAIVVIVAMAIMYIVSAGNPGMMQTAKGGMLAALIGFAIMLSAWLIVNIVLNILVDKTKDPFVGLIKNNAFSFSCDVKSNVNTN